MDFKKFSTDASSFFQRTLQKTEEALKTSDRTLLDADLESLIKQCELRQKWTTSFIALAEAVAQPNPASRMEDMVLKGLDRKKARQTEDEQFAESLSFVGNELGPSNTYGAALIKFGQAQTAVGEHSRGFHERIESSYIQPLRDFLANSYKVARTERDALENYRLDLDRAKTQLRRTKDDAAKKQESEQSVSEKQTLFDRQCETARRAMENCITEFNDQEKLIQQFMNGQRKFYQDCINALQ